jgi:peptide/nickel transport system permease protein
VRAYVFRRLLIGLVVIWGVYTLTFFAVNLAPGDPFANLENPKMQKEDIERLRIKWGYDKPVLERYLLQLRRTFFADPEVLEREVMGIAYEVFAEDGHNRLRARVQVPPATIDLVPTELTRLDGVEGVTLERSEDGTYPSAPLAVGTFQFGPQRLQVGPQGGRLVSQGVVLEVLDGRVTARPTLDEAPDRIVLQGAEGEVVLEPEGDRYGPLTLEPGRYRVEGGDVLIPPEPLQEAGLTFDLGTSVLEKRPVVDYLATPLLNTLILATAALFLDFLIGIFIGVVSATRPNTKTDHALTIGSLFVYSMPGFWLALMLVLLFAVRLDWLPSEGMHDVNETGLLDLLEHMVLPAFVLGIAAAAGTARYQRSALLEVMGQDYIRTARAKGLTERQVIWKHAMRNSLLPVITLFGLSLPFLVSGAVITETIFAWPGMGRAAIKAIGGRDVFVLTGITLIATTMVVIGNLLADILYAVADPRVRLK